MQPTPKPDSPLADRFVVVLNEPQDRVNIAGVARAMLNTGLWRLRLVRPGEWDAYRIAGIAHGAESLLEQVEFFDDLPTAIADAHMVIGTSGRRRTATYVWQHPREAAPELLALAHNTDAPVALVFGREDYGLSNEDLDLCDRVLIAPLNPEHASLNLAQAVLLVCYELWLATLDSTPLPEPKRSAPSATNAELRQTFHDLERSLEAIEFFKTRTPASVMRTLRALLRRGHPSAREAKLVRAVAIEVRKYLERTGRK